MSKDKKDEDEGLDVWDTIARFAPAMGTAAGFLAGRQIGRRVDRMRGVHPDQIGKGQSIGRIVGGFGGGAAATLARYRQLKAEGRFDPNEPSGVRRKK